MLKFLSALKGLSPWKTRNQAPRSHGAVSTRKGFRPVLEELEERLVPALVVDPVNPRYFMDNVTGKVVYLAGSSTWNDNQTIAGSAFSYTQFLNFMQSDNLNFFRLWTFEGSEASLPIANFAFKPVTPTIYVRSNVSGDNDGGNKFDLSQLNQAYFNNVRQEAIEAGNDGIYVAVTLFNGFSVEQKGSYPNPWPYDYFNAANNINGINGDPNHTGSGTEVDTLDIPALTSLQEAYARKLVDTLHDLPNVLFEVANEPDGGAPETAWENFFVNYIHNYEQSTYGMKQPVGFTSEYPNGNNADLFNSNADWIAPNAAASAPYNYQTNPPPATGQKIIVADTDHLGGHTYLDLGFVWRSFAMGENVLFMDTYLQTYFNDPTSPAEEKDMGYAITFASEMNLNADTPQPQLSSTGYCLADASATTPQYFVYLPGGGNATVNLSATTQTLSVEWFNPATDTTTISGTVQGGGQRSFTAPFSGDAILFLNPAAIAVPSPPTNLTAKSGNAQVVLTWTPSNGATSYNLYRSTSSGGESETPYLTGISAATFTNSGLINGTTYYYQVTAVNSSGESEETGQVSATPQLAAPATPTNLSASAGDARVSLNWTPSAGATTYNLYRSTSSGGESETPYLTGISAATFTNSGLTNGTTYYYEVTAVNSAGESEESGEVSAMPQSSAPATPTNLSATAGTTQVTLSWSPAAGATSYNVYRSTSSGGEGESPYVTGISAATFTNSGLTNGTTYYYEVTAVNSAGESEESGEVSATPQSSAPATPTNLSASAGTTQVTLSWSPAAGATSYNVYRSTSSGGEGETPYLTGITATSFTNSGLSDATTYYYEVTAVNASGESEESGEVPATLQATGSLVMAINAGGGQVGSYAADEYWTQAVSDATTLTHPIDTSGVADPAPQGVYQSWRSGNFSYAIPGFTPNGQYLVRLHFAEDFVNAPGQRVFNVSINGTKVLTNFDIVAATGAEYKAIVEQFNVNATSSGMINLQFTTVVGNARLNGIEILTAGTPAPTPPTEVTAAAGNGQVALNWAASAGASSYNIYRSTSSGAEGVTPYLMGVTGTSFTDTGLANGTAYYYEVTAVNSASESDPSIEVSATPHRHIFS